VEDPFVSDGEAVSGLGLEPTLSNEDGTSGVAAKRERVESYLLVAISVVRWPVGVPIVELRVTDDSTRSHDRSARRMVEPLGISGEHNHLTNFQNADVLLVEVMQIGQGML
jgi:hypothetical protein